MFILLFILEIGCGLFGLKQICVGCWSFVYYIYCHWRSNSQWRGVLDLINHNFQLDFQRHISWVFYVQWVEVRGDCMFVLLILVNEWVLFNAKWVIVQLYQATFWWDDNDVRFVLDQMWLDFYSAGSLKQRSAGRHFRFTRTHYPDSGSTNLCSLMISGEAANTNFHRFDPTLTRPDLELNVSIEENNSNVKVSHRQNLVDKMYTLSLKL
jgi:hypothetical protein